jgi:hypothetical protein
VIYCGIRRWTMATQPSNGDVRKMGRGGRERGIDTRKSRSRWSNSRPGDDNRDGASDCEC